MTAVCDLCPHACRLREDETGFCRARTNVGGVIRPTNYGRLTALALDPIEKKPLHHAAGLAVVLVTNGTICAEPLARLLPHVDAMNIDLKGWREDFYRRLGGDLMTVRETITHAVRAGVHVEVTTLIIPGMNDSPAEMDAEARWLAALSLDLPLHISRYFPHHRMQTPPTPIAAIDALTAVAAHHLRYVHRGNC